MSISFLFQPNFVSLESFLKFYQTQHLKNESIQIQLNVEKEYLNTLPGYPDQARNCWLTLRYAVEQMNQTFYSDKSKVKIVVIHQESVL